MKKLRCVHCENFFYENEIQDLWLSKNEPVPICTCCSELLREVVIKWLDMHDIEDTYREMIKKEQEEKE